MPPDGGVREAHTGAAVSGVGARPAREDHATAVAMLQPAAGGAGGRAGTGRGVRRRCPAARGPGRAGRVRAGVGAYRVALAGLWPAAEAAHAAIRAAAEAESELADSRQLLLEASERAAEAREAAGAAAATYQELLATVGTAVEELQRRLAEVSDALGRLRTSERDARQREQGALEARGKADGKQGELRTQVDDAARQRDDAVREFQAFAATGLLRVAVSVAGDPRRGSAVGGDADGDPGPRRQRRT